MHLVGILLAVFGAWLLLALPTAIVVGRFLRVGNERGRTTSTRPHADDSLGSHAA